MEGGERETAGGGGSGGRAMERAGSARPPGRYGRRHLPAGAGRKKPGAPVAGQAAGLIWPESAAAIGETGLRRRPHRRAPGRPRDAARQAANQKARAAGGTGGSCAATRAGCSPLTPSRIRCQGKPSGADGESDEGWPARADRGGMRGVSWMSDDGAGNFAGPGARRQCRIAAVLPGRVGVFVVQSVMQKGYRW